MPTCPHCSRPSATAEQKAATDNHGVLCNCATCGAVCFRAFGLTQACDVRAVPLRAEEDRRIVAMVRACFPPGLLDEVAALLIERAALTGAAPSDTVDGQTVDDHLQHAIDHLLIADNDMSAPGVDVPKPDRDSGRSQFAHAIARCSLAYGLAAREAGR